MADIKEEIIVDVKIDKADTEKQVVTLTEKIAGLRAENAELVKTNKELEKSGQSNSKQYIENSKQIEINKQKITESTASQKALISVMNIEDRSIKALQVRNRELVKQRNEISTATAEGRARIALLNKEINENNDVIRANVSALEDQKMNVGNYTESIKAALAESGDFGAATVQMTEGMGRFLNPLTAAIAGLGALVAAYIKSTAGAKDFAFAQERVNFLLNKGLEALGTLIGGTGAGGTGPLSKFIDLVGHFVLNIAPGMDLVLGNHVRGLLKESEAAAQAAETLHDLELSVRFAQAEFKKDERRAELARRIRDDDTKSLQERLAAAKQVEEFMQRAGDRTVVVLQAQIAAIKQHTVNYENNTEAQLRVAEIEAEIADKTEEVTGKLTENTTAVANLRKEYEALNKEIGEKSLQALRDAWDAKLLIAHQAYLNEKAIRDQAEKEEQEANDRFVDRMKREIKARKDATETSIKSLIQERDFYREVTNAKIDLAATFVGTLTELSGKNKALAITAVLIEKAAAIAGIISNTAVANLKAIAASPLTFGQPWVGINTATGIVAGVGVAAQAAKSVAEIGGFAGGGLTGTRILPGHGTPINRANGDNRLATVRTGEVILNERQQAALGGPDTFRAIGVPGFADGGFTGFTETSIANRRASQIVDINTLRLILANMPRPVVLVEDIDTGQQNRVDVISKATLI